MYNVQLMFPYITTLLFISVLYSVFKVRVNNPEFGIRNSELIDRCRPFNYALRIPNYALFWWAQVDSNHRPRAYQARALTT